MSVIAAKPASGLLPVFGAFAGDIQWNRTTNGDLL
jgi:hypothetical protein